MSKMIKVSDVCAQIIEDMRKDESRGYYCDLEAILEVVSSLNNMICFARESNDLGFFVDGLQRAQDKILDYFGLIKNLSYDYDIKGFGELTVKPAE